MPQPADQHTATNQQAQNTQHYLRVLNELIDLGADMARLVHTHAKIQAETIQSAVDPEANEDFFAMLRPPPPAIMPEPTVAFDRIARAIRRTVLLARKLNEPAPAPTAPNPGDRTAARNRILRDVEDASRGEADEEAECLHAEFLDRLDAADLDEDIASRPVDEIIEDICRDLGIEELPGARPFKRRPPAASAALAAQGATRSPAEARASSAPAKAPNVVAAIRPGQRVTDGKSTDPPRFGPAPADVTPICVHRTFQARVTRRGQQALSLPASRPPFQKHRLPPPSEAKPIGAPANASIYYSP